MSIKVIRSKGYTHYFNRDTGFSARWGDTKEDNPTMCPLGPEILDMEISTICNLKCKACYKSNTDVGNNMSFDKAKIILDKMPISLCQVAYGIGSIKGNPDLWQILEYTRSKNIIPNITVNGHDIDDEEITKLANTCGAVAVSHYNDNDCYGTVKRLTEAKKESGATLRQVNIHQLCCLEKLDECYSVIKSAKEDDRLRELNAVVLMTLKPKGNRNTFTTLDSLEKFKSLFKTAVECGVSLGMDSCAAPQAFKAIESLSMMKSAPSIESCESGIFSSYINVEGDYYPCSFSEGVGEWKNGISVLDASDFVKDIWYNARVNSWRKNILCSSQKCTCQFKNDCRPCPLFDITPCYKT